MTRHLLWMAMAATLSTLLVSREERAFAQGQEAAVEAEADTRTADADASADAAAAPSNEQAESQPATGTDTSAQSEVQLEPADTSATAEAEATTSEGLSNQASTAQDLEAPQQRERSRGVEDSQQPGDQDATTRDRGDAKRQPRERMEDRRGRERGDDVRVGIAFGRATDRGLTIHNVNQNSFYFRSGFRQGDVIVSVHGRPIRNDADFYRLIIVDPGQRVPVVILRDGRRETIYVTYHNVAHTDLQHRHPPMQAGGAYLGVVFDAQVRDATVVRAVNPGSPAQEAGIQSGDIFVAMNGQEVRSYPDAISIVRRMRPGDQLSIVIERAQGENEVVAILDRQPNVRTAVRPDSQRSDPQTITTENSGQIDVDYREDGRLLDRNRNSDGSRGRVLPLRRN